MQVRNAPKGGSTNNPHGSNLYKRSQLLLINDKFPLYDNTPLKTLSFLPEGEQPNEMQRKIVAFDSDQINSKCRMWRR